MKLKALSSSVHLSRRCDLALLGLADSSHIRGLWSVSKINGVPRRKWRNLRTAQTMARHSFSVVVYFFSAELRTLLAYSTTVPRLVERIAPMPLSDASVVSTN